MSCFNMVSGALLFAFSVGSSVYLCVRPRVDLSFANSSPTKLQDVRFRFSYVLFLIHCVCVPHFFLSVGSFHWAKLNSAKFVAVFSFELRFVNTTPLKLYDVQILICIYIVPGIT